MVLCRFFQAGNCTKGNNCNFEHIRPGQASATTSKYNESSIKLNINDERPQWKLSVFGPAKEEPNLIVSCDKSPEEDRLLYYLSMRTTGNEAQFLQAHESASQLVESQVQAITNNTTAAIQHYENERSKQSGPFGGSATNQPFAPFVAATGFGQTNAFGATAFGANKPATAFGQASAFGQPSAFGAAAVKPSAFGQPSAFGSTSALGGGSAFGSTSALGGGSAFGSTSALGGASAFGQPSALGGGSAFGSTSALGGGSAFGSTSALGGGSAFGSTSTLGNTASAFGATSALGNTGSSAFGSTNNSAFGSTSTLGSGNAFGTTATAPAFGTTTTAITPTAFGTTTAAIATPSTAPAGSGPEWEAFSAPQFTYRAIPETEPPPQLC